MVLGLKIAHYVRAPVPVADHADSQNISGNRAIVMNATPDRYLTRDIEHVDVGKSAGSRRAACTMDYVRYIGHLFLAEPHGSMAAMAIQWP